ncbi:DUF4426 domain-containing protein [Rheinheimera sp. 4Y26]|uniref:DUF4426 domain-containing protein n=1 Tax=Rheinheimera sp. 4Y26 TaxID=2977811 RepID=UPI0021B09595|nr:DUF4426 domain-containing protein [Rheinheimera sp. 4Y26]MCT6699082.1 DUF4426 domain-containing protein [Rheinheimera sp. 4Y26]
MKLFTAMLPALLLFAAVASPAQAEQKKQLGPWDVHYIAMPSTLIEPAIASNYKIERSKFNGLVNISVLNSSDQKAQQVTLSGSAKNLLGQQKTLNFTQVVEGEAIYYLAQLPYRNEERMSFVIDIRQGNQNQQLKFEHTFYVE